MINTIHRFDTSGRVVDVPWDVNFRHPVMNYSLSARAAFEASWPGNLPAKPKGVPLGWVLKTGETSVYVPGPVLGVPYKK